MKPIYFICIGNQYNQYILTSGYVENGKRSNSD